MPSILSSDTVVEIKNLSLAFEMEVFHHDSLRDLFVRTLTNPLKALAGPQRTLKIFEDINLDIKKKERVGIIGVNGAGKTTLCRCISGMLRPDKGSVAVDGTIRAIYNPSIPILPELTGRENAELMAKILYPNLSPIELTEVVQESIDFSEIGRFVDTPFKNFSKGMQARLCLSLISSRPCDLLILDEVYDGADEFFRRKISQRTQDLIENSGAAIFVTHSPEQLEAVCNRAIVLNNARIEFDGSVNKAINYYRHIMSRRSVMDWDR